MDEKVGELMAVVLQLSVPKEAVDQESDSLWSHLMVGWSLSLLSSPISDGFAHASLSVNSTV